MFQADFEKPKLEFICNHDAILRLKIKKGLYRLDYNKATNMSYSEKDRLQVLTNVELAFRVGFETRELRGKDTKIGNGQNLIQLVVFDLLKSHMISVEPAVIIGRDAFVYYMTQYLSFLHQAGNHVLFSLPDFDDDRYRLTVDFSIEGSPAFDIQEIHGINVQKINTYLSSVWLKAAMLLGGTDAIESETDWKSTILAQYRSSWALHGDTDSHFHIRLGAPRIQPICSREAILYFTIDEVAFYETSNFDLEPLHHYSNWEVAILVDIVHEKLSDGSVTRCALDLTTARAYHRFCTFPGLDHANEVMTSHCTRLLEFFTASYLDILESVDFHVIYHFDARWQIWDTVDVCGSNDSDSDTGDGIESWKLTVGDHTTKHASWVERVTRCATSGFDHVSAISQSSINALFNTLWTLGSTAKITDHTSAVAKWKYEKFFSATFKPMTIRLLSNGRAIVWIHVERGHLKTLRNWLPWIESVDHKFEDWHLAFEVKLGKCTHAELDVSQKWLTKFAETAVFKEHGSHHDRHLEHLYLDFKHAEFLHEFSSFDTLFHGTDHRPIDQVQAAVHYLKSHYLPHLGHWGLNIIHTVPIWTSKSDTPSCALTSIAFHVYAKDAITRHNWAHISATLEPVIVLLGMTRHRPLPCTRLEYSANWVIRLTKGISYSTVCISRAAFLERRLLHLLSHVNAVTTVVPKFYGIHNGVWKLDLTTWAKHEWKNSDECRWSLVDDQHGKMKYRWQHRDAWKYEHEGTGDVADGTYSIICLTRNFVEIPTASRHKSLDIKLWGEVEIETNFVSGSHRGSAKSSATWDATLCIQSDIDGLKVKVIGSTSPKFQKTVYTGDKTSAMFGDLEVSLRKQLPHTVDLSKVLHELRAFEGIWKYGYAGTQTYHLANPVFTTHGDIMFELRPHVHQTGTSGGSLRPSGPHGLRSPKSSSSLRSNSSFFGKVKEIVNSALHDVADDQHHDHHAQNGYDVFTNGHTMHNGGMHTMQTLSLDVDEKQTIVVEETQEIEGDQPSFLVPEVVVA
ncbi:uncharacterized protein FIBRA_03142 [Fibroporia radiculosa]|uniref:Uncharacterized protein n=1 Tax=Fibroporia radiculosa TaxID=599839 RepID=J4H287_9APHY|nr:uncharacterized protein FIBRA_03142 [Fibroporia radiculosa]CCM01094.1 predicted protein [Fibroporia radiculosa]